MQRKRIQSIEIKAADEGRVTARFATLGVKDHDGDVILPGAIGEQDAAVSAYGHSTWEGTLPVGRASTREVGDEALADLQFFFQTRGGRETFETVKELGRLQEWSFGFTVDSEAPPEERPEGVRRVLKKLTVHEVSPVLRGAGVGTETLAVKGQLPAPADPAQRERDRHWLKALEEMWSETYERVAGERPEGPTRWIEPGPSAVDAALQRECRKAARRSARVSAQLQRLEERTQKVPPSEDHGRAARFTVSVGAKLLRWKGELRRVAWKKMDGMDGKTNGYISPSARDKIFLGRHLSVDGTVSTTLHEAKHAFGQEPWDYQLDREGCEREAREFSARWTESVRKAGIATGWNPSRVEVVREKRPDTLTIGSDEAKAHWNKRVALCRPSANAWEYTYRHGWRRLNW